MDDCVGCTYWEAAVVFHGYGAAMDELNKEEANDCYYGIDLDEILSWVILVDVHIVCGAAQPKRRALRYSECHGASKLVLSALTVDCDHADVLRQSHRAEHGRAARGLLFELDIGSQFFHLHRAILFRLL